MAIKATFEADFKQFTDAVAHAERTLNQFATSAQGLGSAIVASLASTEIRRFAGDISAASSQFVNAFAQEEAAVKSLEAALIAQGGTIDAVKQYRALADEFQHTTKFSDDLLIAMEALFVQVGHVGPAQMGAALQAATNLAAGLGISLESATLLVAKAFGQGGEQLGKLKALLGDTVPKGADMAGVLDAINSKFGGQAAAQLETYSGRMAALNNQMSDFRERVGALIVDALTPLLDAFASMPTSIQTLVIGIVALGTALAPVAISMAALGTILGPLVPLIGTALTGALAALSGFLLPAGALIVGIFAVYEAFKHWDQISAIVQGVYQSVKTWLVDAFDGLVGLIKGKLDTVLSFFTAMYERIRAIFTAINAFGGGLTGAGLAAGAALSGSRANGGPVSAGSAYLVGERGPEVFVPRTAGTVIPSLAGGGFTQYNTFHIIDTESTLAQRISTRMAQTISGLTTQ